MKALTSEQVDQSTKEIFESIKQRVGRVPNLYATMANSKQLLGGYLAFEATLKSGSFSNKENELIALSVSEVNDCNYCLSAHSALGKMAGFTDDQLIAIRKGELKDEKLNALGLLAKEITISRGKVSKASIEKFLSAGYDQKALAELLGMVAIRSLTNYIYSIGEFEIDFPLAAKLDELETA
jgi:uncharacterized peroxidase-related enzyme